MLIYNLVHWSAPVFAFGSLALTSYAIFWVGVAFDKILQRKQISEDHSEIKLIILSLLVSSVAHHVVILWIQNQDWYF